MQQSTRIRVNSYAGEMYNRYEWKLPDGTLHREDGPALEYDDGYTAYHYYGKRHRIDGPAVEYCGHTEWWVNDFCIDTIIIPWAEELGIDLNNFSDEDKILIAMKWSEYGK